jgi:hypothetical protein
MAKRFSVVTEYYGRFRDVGAMEEDSDGAYVLFTDYATLLARAEAAESELVRVRAGGIESMRRVEAAEKERDAIRAERDRMREALEQYADKMNWGFYDMSGCEKGHGRSEDACFLGTDIARAALGGGE